MVDSPQGEYGPAKNQKHASADVKHCLSTKCLFPANTITLCLREYDVPRDPGNVAFTLGFTFSSRKNVGKK